MSEQEALIKSENSNIVLRTDENKLPIDILNREQDVDSIFKLLNTLSEANSSCTFAINGKWGCGKTFLLDMLKCQLMAWEAVLYILSLIITAGNTITTTSHSLPFSPP